MWTENSGDQSKAAGEGLRAWGRAQSRELRALWAPGLDLRMLEMGSSWPEAGVGWGRAGVFQAEKKEHMAVLMWVPLGRGGEFSRVWSCPGHGVSCGQSQV